MKNPVDDVWRINAVEASMVALKKDLAKMAEEIDKLKLDVRSCIEVLDDLSGGDPK